MQFVALMHAMARGGSSLGKRFFVFRPKMCDQHMHQLYILLRQPADVQTASALNAKQIIGGNVEKLRQSDQIMTGWSGDAHFPCVYARSGDKELFCKLRLRQIRIFSKFLNSGSNHFITSFICTVQPRKDIFIIKMINMLDNLIIEAYSIGVENSIWGKEENIMKKVISIALAFLLLFALQTSRGFDTNHFRAAARTPRAPQNSNVKTL